MAESGCPSRPIGRHHHPPRLPPEGQGAGRRRWPPPPLPPPPPPMERHESGAAAASSSLPYAALRCPATPAAAPAPPAAGCWGDPRRRGCEAAGTDAQPPTAAPEAVGNQQRGSRRRRARWWLGRLFLLLLLRGCCSSSSAPSSSSSSLAWYPMPSAARRQWLMLATGLVCCAVLALYAASSLQEQPPLLPPPPLLWGPGEMTEAVPAVTVLLWWEPFGGGRSSSGAGGRGDCRRRFNISACRLTTNRSHQLEAQAVLFHHRDLVLHGTSQLPRLRPPEQLWVWMNFESPSHSHGLQKLGGIFNWTMSYKVDSDVFVPYGYLRPSRGLNLLTLPRKTKLVAWVISNWNEGHARVRYYHRLKDHLPIDVYGAQGLELKDESVVKTVSEYKFYLAFENSQHPDYITEKLWRNAFSSWTVPVVLGPPRSNYELFIPSDSFIHVDDFSSPMQLAVYLKFLDKNKSRYKRYFAWRKHYEARVTSFWDEHCCRVCDAVRTMGKQHKTIENLANWFNS